MFSFLISPLQLYEAESVYLPSKPESLLRTETSVRLHLQSSHFRNGAGGPYGSVALVLRCTARIENFYDEYSEATMRTTAKDPVPDRGKLQINSTFRPQEGWAASL